jgi:hypothetical protein
MPSVAEDRTVRRLLSAPRRGPSLCLGGKNARHLEPQPGRRVVTEGFSQAVGAFRPISASGPRFCETNPFLGIPP